MNYAAVLYRRYQEELASQEGVDDKAQILRLENDRLDAMQMAFWDEAMEGNTHAGKMVLDVMKHRAAINGLNQIDLRDVSVHNNVLVVGQDQRGWVEALAQHGTHVASAVGDDVVEEASDE